MFWGLTPSLDLLQELHSNGSTQEEVNILLITPSDPRHIIKTLARRYRKQPTKINFYILEPIPEVIAKQMLLLNIALQPVEVLGAVQKTRIFMELFGNTVVRPTTARYLSNRTKEFIKMITNLDYLERVMGIVRLDLKYKERDYIESVFKFWAGNDDFNVNDYWDRRLRKFLGVRYDTKSGVFDWDLHMKLYHIGGNTICGQEYQSFRNTGVAFTWLESEVTKPNRTMVTGVIGNGDSFAHYGYLGEMQTGPFIAYGIESDDLEFLKKQNNMNKYRSTDITERNLREMFHEIEFNEEYTHQKTSDVTLGTCIAQLGNLKVLDATNVTPSNISDNKCLDLDNVTINFLSMNKLNMMQHKEEYKGFFNLVYFGSMFSKYFNKETVEWIAAPKCLILIEHQKFIVTHRDDDLEKYYKDVNEKMSGMESYECPFDFKKDSYIKFVLK